jgi:hypothetical protein
VTFLLTALSFLKRVPWQAYAAIAAALALWWLYSAGFDRGLAKGRAELAAAVAAYEDAQEQAHRLALAAKAEQEARYRELAGRIDNDHVRNQAAASSATDRFIAANRVQPCPAGGATGGTPASPDDHSAGLPAPLSPGIVLGEADVRACAALYTYAADAHKWAREIGQE